MYLKERLQWDQKQLDELFRQCGSHLSFLDSDDNWFNQDFADRFYATAVRLSGEEDLAYKAGAYSVHEARRGIGGRIIQGSFSPTIAFKNIQRITEAFTKGSYYEPIKVTPGRAIIRAKVIEGCNEKLYQCRNRLGALEAIPSVFGRIRKTSSHNVCLHLGGPYCEYEFTWTEPIKNRPIPLALSSGFVVGILTLPLFGSRWESVLAGLSCTLISYLFSRELLLAQLKNSMAEQNEGLEESVKIMSRRRDEQILIQDIVKSTSEMMPIGQLCQVAVSLVREKMQYDRVALALVDESTKKTIRVVASAGYEDITQGLGQTPEFNVRSENTSGLLIRVVNTNQSILEQNVQGNMAQYSERTQALLKRLGTPSFDCGPRCI